MNTLEKEAFCNSLSGKMWIFMESFVVYGFLAFFASLAASNFIASGILSDAQGRLIISLFVGGASGISAGFIFAEAEKSLFLSGIIKPSGEVVRKYAQKQKDNLKKSIANRKKEIQEMEKSMEMYGALLK